MTDIMLINDLDHRGICMEVA